MTFPRLRITSNGPAAVGSTIEIDGQPIRCIRSIRIEGAVDDLWRVHVEFVAGSVDVDVLARLSSSPADLKSDSDGVEDVTTVDADSRVYRKTDEQDESIFDLSVEEMLQLHNFKPRLSLMDRIARKFGLQSTAIR